MNSKKNGLTYSFSNEAKLIFLCSRLKLSKESKKEIEFLLERKLDWKYILDACNYHKVIPLVYNSLGQIEQKNIPLQIREKLSNFYRLNACNSLIYIDKLIKITNALASRGIKTISFKGPILSFLVYKDLALRTFGDIDLLIKDVNLEKTLDVLQELKYPPPLQISQAANKPYLNFSVFHESAKYQKSFDIYDHSSNIVVELHWSLFNQSFAFDAKFDQLWQHKIDVEILDANVSVFCAEHLILYLCAHAAKHGFSTLQWICDIAELIRINPQLNWQKVESQAQSWGCQRMLYLGLILAQNLLGADLPKNIRQNIDSDFKAQLLAKEVSDRLFDFEHSEFSIYLFIFKCRERYRDKLWYLLCTLFVPKKNDWHFFRVPKSLQILYYIIRPIRLLTELFSKLVKSILPYNFA